MKVSVKNLGILKEADFTVGDLTIICGTNNTGKTYATYSLYGFLKFWNEVYVPDLLETDTVKGLMQNGYERIELEKIRKSVDKIIDRACKELNSLIMLHNADSVAERVMEKYGYQENELLDAARIKAYIARKELIRIDGKARRQKHNTLVPAPIGEHGIEMDDFDETINIMNDIQEEIIFGDI